MGDRISRLKANVSRDRASHILSGRGLRRWIVMWRQGTLIDVRGVYVPFHLFRVTVSNNARDETTFVALDAVTGECDLYQLDAPPNAQHLDALDRTAVV